MSTKKKSALVTFGFYWRFMKAYPLNIAGLVISLPIVVLFNQFLPPLIIANVLQRLSNGDYIAGQLWQSFGSDILLYGGLVLISSVVLWRIVDLLVWTLEGHVLKDLNRASFNHLVSQSADFHANRFSGSMVSQNNKAMGAYVRIGDTTWFNVIPLISSIVIASIVLWPKSPLFVLFLIGFSIFYVVASFRVSAGVRKAGAIHAAAESKQTGYLADVLTNVMAVKSFAGEVFERLQFKKITDKTHAKLVGVMHAHEKQMLFFGGFTSTLTALSFAIAIFSVVYFGANIATVFLILNYAANIVTQLFQFSNMALRNYNRAIGDAAELIEMMNTEPEIKDPENPEKPRIHRGLIEFKNVTFTHKEAASSIFKNMNLRIKPGEKVGLVGHSGSGKSSLTRILLRFSDLDSGAIEIDGQNIAKITQADLRSSISYVPQEPLLFHRTIAENISYGKQHVDQQEVEAVAKQAHASEFILKLPKQYETLVGERGVKLSGGQRQRVAIARAMLKNAPILILDEATSALDSESEALIQDALWKLMEGRTALVIAHRLSTIQKMDRILVMQDGRVVEEGTHKELVSKSGVYAELWQRQSGGFLED